MKKVVWTFGLISGGHPLRHDAGDDAAAVEARIRPRAAHRVRDDGRGVVAHIHFGVRSYRDNVGGGTVGFGRALAVALLIGTIASACYVATWEVLFFGFMPDFGEQYAARQIDKLKASGAPQAEIDKQVDEMKKFAQMYKNPLVNVAYTFLEPLPVEVLVSLVSAGVIQPVSGGGTKRKLRPRERPGVADPSLHSRPGDPCSTPRRAESRSRHRELDTLDVVARRPLLSFLASLVGLWTFLALTGAWVVSTAQLAPGVPLALVTCALLTIANLIHARARGRGRAAVLGLAALVPLVCGAEYPLDSVLGWLPYDGPSIVLVVGIVGYGCALLVARAAVHFLAQPPVRFGLDMSRLAAALVIAACASGAGLAVQKRLTHDDPVAWRARTMDLGFLGLHTVSGAIVPSPPCRYLGEPATRTCPPSVRGVLSNHSEDGVSPLPDARHTCHVDVSDETGRARALTLEEVPSARPCSSFELRRVAGTMWIAISGVRYDDASFHTFVDPEDADWPIPLARRPRPVARASPPLVALCPRRRPRRDRPAAHPPRPSPSREAHLARRDPGRPRPTRQPAHPRRDLPHRLRRLRRALGRAEHTGDRAPRVAARTRGTLGLRGDDGPRVFRAAARGGDAGAAGVTVG